MSSGNGESSSKQKVDGLIPAPRPDNQSVLGFAPNNLSLCMFVKEMVGSTVS